MTDTTFAVKDATSKPGPKAPPNSKDVPPDDSHPNLGAGTPLEDMFHDSSRKPPKQSDTALYKGLTDFYTQIGAFVSAFDPQCGTTIIAQAPTCAGSLDKLAKENPAVKKALQKLLEGSAMGAVLMAHAPIAFAIAMHHVPALQERADAMATAMMSQDIPAA